MCTLMDWPIFACASWAAADSSYLTNDFFFSAQRSQTRLRPDNTDETSHNKLLGEKRPPDGAVPLLGGQLWRPESSEGHMTQQPASVLHEPTRRETDQTLIWGDRRRGHVGGGDAEEEYHTTLSKLLLCLIQFNRHKTFKSNSRFGWLISALVWYITELLLTISVLKH